MTSTSPSQPAPLPPFADADFERLGDARLLELQRGLALEDGEYFSVFAPKQLDVAGRSELPVVLASLITTHRAWDVQSSLNLLVSVTDLATGRTSFHFPLAANKPVLEEGRSRYGPEPEQPWENSVTSRVLLLPLPLGDAAAGGRVLVTRAIYFDWATPPVLTTLAGVPPVISPERPTEAPWLRVEPAADPGLEPGAAAAMRLYRLENGVQVASGRLVAARGQPSVAATLLMVRKDDSSAHTQRFVVPVDAHGTAMFQVNLDMALGARKRPPERIYLFTGSDVLGPFNPGEP